MPGERLRRALRFVNFRVLRNTPAKVWRALEEDDAVAIVANGETRAILVNVPAGDTEEAIQMARQVIAQQALARLRASARERGLSDVSDEEIDAEIRAARAERKRD